MFKNYTNKVNNENTFTGEDLLSDLYLQMYK